MKNPTDLSHLTYTTGTGQTLYHVHDSKNCAGRPCVIHNPSDHSMRDFKTHWRADRGLMERICPHGVGHPDPDHLAYVRDQYGIETASLESVHGCCGICCQDAYNEVFPTNEVNND